MRRLRCAARCPIDEQTSAIRAENRVGVWCLINIRTSHDMNEILTTAHILTFGLILNLSSEQDQSIERKFGVTLARTRRARRARWARRARRSGIPTLWFDLES